MQQIADTKERIFDAFVELASESGYENVTTRDIARRIGINAASIYYHFESKERILEFAYDYYMLYEFEKRNSIGRMKKLIEAMSLEEVIYGFFYKFAEDDRKKYVRMTLIAKIIYMRIYQDSRANSIFLEGIKNSAEYAKEVLQHGIDAGRLDPSFDIEAFADILIDAASMMVIRTFAESDYTAGQGEREKHIHALLTTLLKTAVL